MLLIGFAHGLEPAGIDNIVSWLTIRVHACAQECGTAEFVTSCNDEAQDVRGRPTSRSPLRTWSPEPAPSIGISLLGVTQAAITLVIRMPAAYSNACWLTPDARAAPA